MPLLILGLVLFVILVIVHEFGHFIAAKKNGVDVEEFGLGFPPKLYGKKMGRGIFRGYYSVNALPLGGFVRLKGEHDSDTQKGSYGATSLKGKIQILLAGVTMNFIVAVIMFMLIALIGMPQLVANQFTVKSDSKIIKSSVIASYVGESSPAEKAGLRAGDVIKSIGNNNISSSQSLRDATKANQGKKVVVVYEREGQPNSVNVSLLGDSEVEASKKTDNPKGYLGVSSSEYKLARSTWSAPIVAVGSTTQFISLTLKALGGSLANLGKAAINGISGKGQIARQNASAAGENVSGPVGIYAILKQGSSLGFQFILFVVALISLTLAIMNILPIPALDGGRLFVTLVYRVSHRTLTQKTEELIHGTGFAILMLLFIVITVVDVKRFF